MMDLCRFLVKAAQNERKVVILRLKTAEPRREGSNENLKRAK